MGNWISATERLPEENGRYIVCRELINGKKIVEIDTFFRGQGMEIWRTCFSTFGGRITHWMPLPDLPKEGE